VRTLRFRSGSFVVKLYFTFGNETREGFESRVPGTTPPLDHESVDEIQGQDVLEKVPDLIVFIDECYRLLRPAGKCVFSGAHYGHARAWASPLNRRALSEQSLNFSSKDWREQNKYTEATCLSDFEVHVQFAVEDVCASRSDDAKAFWMQRYLNIAQAVLFTLTKK
jgi:SAM-dependent methyltransferase